MSHGCGTRLYSRSRNSAERRHLYAFRGLLEAAGYAAEVGNDVITSDTLTGKRRHGKPQLRVDEARRWQAKALQLAEEGEGGAVSRARDAGDGSTGG